VKGLTRIPARQFNDALPNYATAQARPIGGLPHADHSAGQRRLIPPEIPKPIGCQRRISRRVLDVATPGVDLQRSGIDAVIGELEAARMKQHVRMGS
jgi:hypothetical protein